MVQGSLVVNAFFDLRSPVGINCSVYMYPLLLSHKQVLLVTPRPTICDLLAISKGSHITYPIFPQPGAFHIYFWFLRLHHAQELLTCKAMEVHVFAVLGTLWVQEFRAISNAYSDKMPFFSIKQDSCIQYSMTVCCTVWSSLLVW